MHAHKTNVCSAIVYHLAFSLRFWLYLFWSPLAPWDLAVLSCRQLRSWSRSLSSSLSRLLVLPDPLAPPPCHLIPLLSPGLSVDIICPAKSFLTPHQVMEPSCDSQDTLPFPSPGLITWSSLLFALYSSLDYKFYENRKPTRISYHFIPIFYVVPSL